jgi:predicted MPP superfamily phosphohydrolase
MRRLLLSILALGLALAMFGMATAVQDPVVVRYRVAVAGLSRPLTIIQLSDLHASWIDMPPARLNRIVASVNARRPDLVLLTGDYMGAKLVDWPRMRLEDALYPLARLQAPLGVWAAPGNHDEPYWTRWAFARTPVHLLASDVVDLGPISLLGIDDLVLGAAPELGLTMAAQRASRAKPLIAFAHEPDFWRVLPANVDVLIAGHTHGGQIYGYALNDFYRRYSRGLFRNAAGQQMLVSSGIGTTALPLRLGVPPEIVEISLVPAQSPAAAPRR